MADDNEIVVQLGIELAKDALRNLAEFQESIGSTVEKILALTGIVAGAALFKNFVQSAIDTADELEELSITTGVSTDALQEWGYAAAKAGLDAKAVQKDLTGLATRFGLFGPGADAAEEALGRLADRMEGMEDHKAIQLGAMYGIGADTSRLLANEGRAGLQASFAEAHAVGAVITEERLKLADQYNDELGHLQYTLKQIGTTMGLTVVPYMLKTVQAMKDWIFQNRLWLQLRLNAIMEGLAMSIQRVWNVIQRLWEGFKKLLGPAKEIGEIFKDSEVWCNLFTGAIVALAVALAPLLIPMAKMVAIGTAVSLVLEDLFGYFSGDTISATGMLLDLFEKKFPTAFEACKIAINGTITILKTILDTISSFASNAWEQLKTLAEPIDGLLDAFGELFVAITNALGGSNTIIGAFTEAIHMIGEGAEWAFNNILIPALKLVIQIATNAVKAITELVKIIKGGIGGAVDFVSGAVDSVKDFFGFGKDEEEENKQEEPQQDPGYLTKKEEQEYKPHLGGPWKPIATRYDAFDRHKDLRVLDEDEDTQAAAEYLRRQQEARENKAKQPNNGVKVSQPIEDTKTRPVEDNREAQAAPKIDLPKLRAEAQKVAALVQPTVQMQAPPRQTGTTTQVPGKTTNNTNSTNINNNQQINITVPTTQEAVAAGAQFAGMRPQISSPGIAAPVAG